MKHTVETKENSVCWGCRKKQKKLKKLAVRLGTFYAYFFLCMNCLKTRGSLKVELLKFAFGKV